MQATERVSGERPVIPRAYDAGHGVLGYHINVVSLRVFERKDCEDSDLTIPFNTRVIVYNDIYKNNKVLSVKIDTTGEHYYIEVLPNVKLVPELFQPFYYFEDLPKLSRKFVGVLYAPRGSDSIKGFDSPNFICTLFGCLSIKLPNTLSDLKNSDLFKSVSNTEAKPGDLVFLNTHLNDDWVALYLGDGKVIAPFKRGARPQVEEESLETLAKEGFTILEFKRLKRDIPSLVEYATSLVGQTISYSTLYSVRDVYWRFRVHIPSDMNEARMSYFFDEVSESERKPGDLVIGLGECNSKLLGILVSEDQIVWRPERKPEAISLADFKKQHPSKVTFKRPKTIPESY